MAFDAGAVIGRLELNIAGWQKSVEAVKKDQQSLAGLVMRHEQQFKSLGKTFTVVGGLMVASLGAMIKSTANYGDEMDEMHQRTGASVELLTGLDGALRKNGASTQDLAVGMKFLSGKMVDANSGNKEAIALFKGLGISVTDANGELRSTTDVLFDVATRFAGMENGAVKTTIAIDLLGRGGMSLIPTLNLGADGLKREADEAGRLGKVLTQETAKACSDFNDSLVDLKGGLQGVGIQIGTVLMPLVQNLVNSAVNAVTKIVAWTKSHEDLTRVLGTTVLGLGGVMMAVGPMLYMLPGLVKGWETLAAVLKLSTLALSASVIGLTALVAAAGIAYDTVTRLTNAKNEATEADYRAFESNQKLGQKLREVADAAGLTRAEFHQLSLKYDDNNAAMAMAIKRGTEGKTLQESLAKVGKEHAAVIDEQRRKQAEMDPVTRALQEALKKTKETTTELVATWAPNASGMILLTNGAISARDVMRGFAGTLTTTFTPAARDMRLVMAGAPATFNEAGSAAGAFSLQVAEIGRQMGLSAAEVRVKMYNIVADINAALGIFMKKLPEVGKQAVATTSSFLQEVSTVIADSMKEIASAIAGLFNFKGLFGAMPEMPKFDSSYFDAMVDAANAAFDAVKAAIESSIDAVRSALDKELSGIKSYYDKLEESAKSAYDKVADAAKASFDKAEESARSAFDKIEKNIRAAYDAFEEAAKAAYDAVEDRISRQQSIEDRARSWHDTFEDRAISRQQEREDRAFSRQYEKDREAIENSKMTRAEKDAALAALARKYEHEQDVREMKRQHEADVRQRAREHADLVRELARERAKEARERAYDKAKELRERAYDKAKELRERAYDKAKELREIAFNLAAEARAEAFQLKLNDLRTAQATAEQAARDTAAGKEAQLLRDLLSLQNAHQLDLDNIRIAEDLARQKQADNEEDRQNSLWFKVKGIFGTACTQMATIFFTEMLKPVGGMIADLAKKLIGKGKGELGKTFDDVSGNVKGLGATIGEFISGIGAGIGGFISGLATGVGLAITTIAGAIAGAIVALATGIATAAGILVAALPDLMLIAAAALAIYAGFTIVKGLVDKIFGKKMDTGPMEYWLKLMWELLQNSYNFYIGPLTWKLDTIQAGVIDIMNTAWNINNGIGAAVGALYHISTKVDASTGYLKSTVGYLKTIAEKISSMTSIAAGAVSYQPSMAMVRGTSSNTEYALWASRLAGPTGARGGGQGPINLTIPFYLDGKLLDERMLRIANGRVKWLDQQYQRSNKLIPARSIGGAG